MSEDIFGIGNEAQFTARAIETFRYQYKNCQIYRKFCELSEIDADAVENIDDLPFLPIRFFKQYDIISSACSSVNAQKIFYSSSTTGMTPSRHCVLDISLYEKSFLEGFRQFYGDPEDYVILALLPSYLEREGSSLVYMTDRLIKESGKEESGYYLYDYDKLYRMLQKLAAEHRKTILIGVAFALLDFGDKYHLRPEESENLIVMETGGMKGRREELSREELHRRLSQIFSKDKIHSEYGMCELLSQAYSSGDGIFFTPSWMKVIIKDVANPLKSVSCDRKGIINIIDLANINSCSFIETEDVGRNKKDGSFLIDGRLKGSERRGCNMLIEI